MELSLRLDTLGLVEMNYLRSRDRYRDWPPFQLLAASRQARIMAYLTHDVAEQLHEQILMVEAAVGLDIDDTEDEEDDEDEEELSEEEQELELESGASESSKTPERESSSFSPSFAQALERLNELARQRLPEGTTGAGGAASENIPSLPKELTSEIEAALDEEDAIEQLQEAFIQMMAVVRELAEELATDALKLTSRFRCGRTKIEFVQAEISEDEDETGDEEDEDEEGEIELVMVLQLFEEGRSRPDDLPVAELQLDVDDFERLHETLDIAFEHERRSSRRRR